MRSMDEIRISQGVDNPYDANDDGDPPPAVDKAHIAARGIIADLTDRGGIKHGFNDIDHPIRVEIVDSLAAIIRLAMEMPEPPAVLVKTLRDEFAMAALTGVTAQMDMARPATDLARESYLVADAMLEARS